MDNHKNFIENSSCRSNSVTKQNEICNQCGQMGHQVKNITVISLVKEKTKEIQNQLFYFCKNINCNTVYFNNKVPIYIYKDDIAIRIGIKEKESPIPMCYCFGWTQEKILNQIQKQGYTTVIEEISAKVKKKECDCVRKNPSGMCCLGEIKTYLKSIQKQ